MKYRVLSDEGDDDFGEMSEYIQMMMQNSGRDDIVDTLLILSNICDARALLNGHNPIVSGWYARTGAHTRDLLEELTRYSTLVLPDERLEDPLLYFDMNLGTH